MSEETSSEPIRIFVSNQLGYVWTPEEVYTLRANHHITGILTGTLPSAIQQNFFLGLPLQLLYEEIVLLVEDGNAILIDDKASHNLLPTPEQLAQWEEARLADIKAQQEGPASGQNLPGTPGPGGKQKGKGRPGVQDTSEAAIKKRLEREAKKAAAAAAAKAQAQAQAQAEGETVQAPTSSTEAAKMEDVSQLLAPEDPAPTTLKSDGAHESAPALDATDPRSDSLPPHTVTIPATSFAFPWYPSTSSSSTSSPSLNPSSNFVHTTLASAREAQIWKYPSTLEERARCSVFRALHEKGYWMGGGIRFGGDYLVYPGDPLRYHSHFVATVYPTPTSSIRPIEIVALGRLGTATKKSHLLCGYDDSTKAVDFYSLEWSGFG